MVRTFSTGLVVCFNKESSILSLVFIILVHNVTLSISWYGRKTLYIHGHIVHFINKLYIKIGLLISLSYALSRVSVNGFIYEENA